MFKSNIQIGNHEWVITLDEYKELSFYLNQLVRDEDAGKWWKGGDDSPSTYFIPTTKDDVLPTGLSSVSTVRKIILEIVKLINRYKITFFYFRPSTDRKATFYINIFTKYLTMLNGKWEYQIIDKKWFYFNKVS